MTVCQRLVSGMRIRKRVGSVRSGQGAGLIIALTRVVTVNRSH